MVGDHDHARRGRRNDLLAQQRSPAPFDQAQVRRDLVGAIDRKIELRHLVECGEHDAKPLGLRAGGVGGRDCLHLQPAPDPFTQQIDEMCCGGAGAKPDTHPGPDKVKRAGCGSPLLQLDIASHEFALPPVTISMAVLAPFARRA